jgi:hypothetical protein
VRIMCVVMAGLLLAVSSMTGCADDGRPSSTASPSPSPSMRAPTADARDIAETRAVEAYRGMWRAFADAGAAGNPEHPDLPRFADEAALRVLVSGLQANKKQGLVSRGDIVYSPKVTAVAPVSAPTEVTIVDCADTSKAKRVKTSGAPFQDAPGGRRLIRATVRGGDDAWKVTTFAVNEVGSC